MFNLFGIRIGVLCLKNLWNRGLVRGQQDKMLGTEKIEEKAEEETMREEVYLFEICENPECGGMRCWCGVEQAFWAEVERQRNQSVC